MRSVVVFQLFTEVFSLRVIAQNRFPLPVALAEPVADLRLLLLKGKVLFNDALPLFFKLPYIAAESIGRNSVLLYPVFRVGQLFRQRNYKLL